MARPRRHVYVATRGGHLGEMLLLATSLPACTRETWVTSDSPQARDALAGAEVVTVPHAAPRQVRPLLRAVPRFVRTLLRRRPTHVYSTGAGLALVTLPLAPLVGARAVYLESLARVSEPSLTGRLLRRVPWVECVTQHRSVADRRWRAGVSLLDRFVAVPGPAPQGPLRVLVCLGTQQGYPFRRVVERLEEVLPADADVVWQLGCTPATGLRGRAEAFLPADEFAGLVARADVVVAHAGVGVLLDALRAGTTPVLVPRRAARGEHVDDHQVLLARLCARRGLAVHVEAADLRLEHLVAAASRSVTVVRPEPRAAVVDLRGAREAGVEPPDVVRR